MGRKNRNPGGLQGAKMKRSSTTAKVANKKLNKEKRNKFKEASAQKKAAMSKEVNHLAAAESGVAVIQNARAYKKAQRRAATRADRERKKLREAERNAPVRPEDVLKVLHGTKKARDAAAEHMAELTELKKLRNKGLITKEQNERLQRLIRGNFEAVDSDEEEAEEKKKNKKSTRAADSDDDSDEEEDDEEEQEEKEEEEEDAKAKAKRERQAKKEKARAEGKGIFIPPKLAAAMKARGQDPKEYIAERLRLKKAKQQAHKEKELERQRAREAEWERAEANMRDTDDEGNDNDADDEEDMMRRYEEFFNKQTDLEKAPVLEKVQQERIRQRALERAERLRREADELDADEDGEGMGEEEEEEGEGEEGDLVDDAPDADDDDEKGAFDDLSSDEYNEDEEEVEFDTDNDDDDDDDVDMAMHDEAEEEEEEEEVEETKDARANKKRKVRESEEVYERRARKAATFAPADDKERDEAKGAKRRLPVKLEDGTWAEGPVAGDDADDGEEEDGTGAKAFKPDLTKYKRKSKEERDKEKAEALRQADGMAKDPDWLKNSNASYIVSNGTAVKGRIAAALANIDGRKGTLGARGLDEGDGDGEDEEEENDEEEEDKRKRRRRDDDIALPKHALMKEKKAAAAAAAKKKKEKEKEVPLSKEAAKKVRMARLKRVQLAIAELCEDILAQPEKAVVSGHLHALRDLCKDNDSTARQLAMISTTQVMVDLIPAYRIRTPTKEEIARETANGKMLSREVLFTRKFERGLLDIYVSLVKLLRRSIGGVLNKHRYEAYHTELDPKAYKGTPTVAMKCLCRLFERGYAFNLSKEIAEFLAKILTSRSAMFRDVVAETVKHVFRVDIAGDTTLEIVQAIAKVFKTKGGDNVRAPLLEVLLHLPLSREILTAKEIANKVGGGGNQVSKRKKMVEGAGNHALNAIKTMQEKKRLEAKGKGKTTGTPSAPLKGWGREVKKVNVKQLARDMEEGDADVSIMHRKKTQTAILSMVCTIYFRYLKAAPTLKTLFTKDQVQDDRVRIGFNYSSAQASGKPAAATPAAANGTANGTTTDANGKSSTTTSSTTTSSSSTENAATIRGEKVALGLVRTGVPPPPPPLPSQLILAAVLDGIKLYAPLVNLEILLDLLEHLKLVVGASAQALSISPSAEAAAEAQKLGVTPKSLEVKAEGVLPLRSALICIHTAFTLLKTHNYSITIDLTAFYRHFYEVMWQLYLPSELNNLPLMLECFDLLVIQQRHVSVQRVAALCRRFMIIAHALKPNIGVSILQAVGRALVKHPRVTVLLENEGLNSGNYDPLISDPDLSNSLASPCWDMTLWSSSYHPFAERFISHATNLPQILQFKGNKAGAAQAAQQAATIAASGKTFTGESDATPSATSTIAIPIAGERVQLARFNAVEILRLLDATRGAFVPDIDAPSAQSIAITEPDKVPLSTAKQALSRAWHCRVEAAKTKCNASKLLPRVWNTNSKTTGGNGAAKGEENKEMYAGASLRHNAEVLGRVVRNARMMHKLWHMGEDDEDEVIEGVQMDVEDEGEEENSVYGDDEEEDEDGEQEDEDEDEDEEGDDDEESDVIEDFTDDEEDAEGEDF